jgi:HK97 family phage prohead protease
MPDQLIARSYPLADLVVRTEGDGRTVDAYAAVFATPTEIRDFDGHYFEVIDRSAFDVTIRRGTKISVLFNHGTDIYGNASDRFSMPIGTPESITADARGLRTVTRIAQTPLGDEVLELMRSGAIDGFSFSGKPLRSQRVPAAKGDDLSTIVRQELALKEYGPAVFRAYDDARVLAMRSDELAEHLAQLPSDQLEELVGVLRSRVSDPQSSDSASIDDNTASPDRAAGEFDHQRRLLAARLRGLTP